MVLGSHVGLLFEFGQPFELQSVTSRGGQTLLCIVISAPSAGLVLSGEARDALAWLPAATIFMVCSELGI